MTTVMERCHASWPTLNNSKTYLILMWCIEEMGELFLYITLNAAMTMDSSLLQTSWKQQRSGTYAHTVLSRYSPFDVRMGGMYRL